MKETIGAIFSAPLATILVVAGIVFLLIAVLGAVAGRIDPGKGGRIAAGAIGIVLLAVGLGMHLMLAESSGSDERALDDALVQQQAEADDRQQEPDRQSPDPCEPIRVPAGATCRDFYAERRTWDLEKIRKCGRYQVSRYREALKISSQREWERFVTPCK